MESTAIYSNRTPRQEAQRTSTDASTFAVRRRSAALQADPKAQELLHFVSSRRHEARLKDAAGLSESPKFHGRSPTAAEAARVLQAAQAAEDHEDVYQGAQALGFAARLRWRDEMDRQVKRLMQDADITLQDSLQESDKARIRCNHLDKTYAWFQSHGKKEASKEQEPPRFLRFESTGPVMPGSLRAHRPSQTAREILGNTGLSFSPRTGTPRGESQRQPFSSRTADPGCQASVAFPTLLASKAHSTGTAAAAGRPKAPGDKRLES
eukprot:TRINITY_DN5622_c0_g1_i4.p1 TRINITY_DN5622_c0_g1~~TRINITY_DN5622_c0_g1_i4.p1  ORF type:complete len:282 (+),score=51.53 TRINITY_DN5622_c0_g1_i4:49-846(+)